jgi:hypothetical protein
MPISAFLFIIQLTFEVAGICLNSLNLINYNFIQILESQNHKI